MSKRTYNNRWSARRDKNEPEIIAELVSAGASVWRLNQKDIPDLLCGYLGALFLIEIKTPEGALEPGQRSFFMEAYQANLPVFLADHIDDVPVILNIIEFGNTGQLEEHQLKILGAPLDA